MPYDLIIIGSGAAGLSAGIYAGRYGMRALVIGKEFGGETAKAGAIFNYPGFQSADGYELMDLMKQQAVKLSVEALDAEVASIARQERRFAVIADKKTYEAKTVILAVGAERRRLGLPNEKELTGRGVHYCVTCDGPVYTGKTIAVIGGGDASVKGVILEAEYAKKIFLIARRKEIKAEPMNLDSLRKLENKVEIILETEVKSIIGKSKLEKLILSRPYKGSTELIVDGLFVEIGAMPNTSLAESLGVELDDRGYIKVDNAMLTNIGGVFAAGDVTDHFGSFKQAIAAAAMGAVAANSAHNYNKIHG